MSNAAGINGTTSEGVRKALTEEEGRVLECFTVPGGEGLRQLTTNEVGDLMEPWERGRTQKNLASLERKGYIRVVGTREVMRKASVNPHAGVGWKGNRMKVKVWEAIAPGKPEVVKEVSRTKREDAESYTGV